MRDKRQIAAETKRLKMLRTRVLTYIISGRKTSQTRKAFIMTKEIKAKLKKQKHDDRIMAKRARGVLMICRRIICGKTLTEKEKEILEKYFYDRRFDLHVDQKDPLEAFAYCRCWDAGMKRACEKFLRKETTL